MNREQKALLDKARDSLDAARILAASGHLDFAASRAYYTMFYVAQALLLDEGLTFSKHSATISVFGRDFAKTGRVPQRFHRYLIEGQASRNTADYDIEGGLTREEAAQQIDRAGEFLELGRRHLGDPCLDG